MAMIQKGGRHKSSKMPADVVKWRKDRWQKYISMLRKQTAASVAKFAKEQLRAAGLPSDAASPAYPSAVHLWIEFTKAEGEKS